MAVGAHGATSFINMAAAATESWKSILSASDGVLKIINLYAATAGPGQNTWDMFAGIL